MNKPPDRPALGKGLSSLLPPRLKPTGEYERPVYPTELRISELHPSPQQPRRNFSEESLVELAQSIKTNGIVQPLVVRPADVGWEIIAGERRWRAAKLAGLTKVPVVVNDVQDGKVVEIALIENIQREDLNPIEMAEAFDRMVNEFRLSHEEIGQRTGKDRVTITNTIRLLQLQPEVRQIVASGKMSAGHARALIGIKDPDRQKKIAYSVLAENWTVRQIEKEVKDILQGSGGRPQKPPLPPVDPNVRAAIDDMQQTHGTRVRVVESGKGNGRIEIEYYSADDLDRIYGIITNR